MFYHEINLRLPVPPSTKSEQVIPLLGETLRECFVRHQKRCVFKVGDYVGFKRPKRNSMKGRITRIVEELDEVTWVKGKLSPYYISIEVPQILKDGTNGTFIVKTNESKIYLIRNKS